MSDSAQFLAYRTSESERARTADLLRIVPKNRRSVLDIGARDGFFSALLREHFDRVTALDLQMPRFQIEGIQKVQGDVTHLDFPDNAFDVVFCAEVLEHVPQLDQACHEIGRVAGHAAVIGVPYKQDIRFNRTTCRSCGRVSPGWGHVNSFDERKLERLFAPLKPVSTSFIGSNNERTNALSVALMDFAGNPWGTYGQEEPCIHCGSRLAAAVERSFVQRVSSAAAYRLNALQSKFVRPHANWIHVVFQKSLLDGTPIIV